MFPVVFFMNKSGSGSQNGFELDRASAAAPAPSIWLVTDGRHVAQRKRIAAALLNVGLPAERELTAAELERYARERGVSQPDVVVFACELARNDCGLLRRLRHLMPYVQSVIVSSTSNPVVARRALEMGAKGLVDEHRLEYTLGAAVRAVAAGLLALSPDARSGAEKPIFTHREKEALALVVDGLTNSEIAGRLQLSESTVKSHLASVFVKLGVHSRSEAATLVLDPECGLASIALPPRRRHLPRAGLRMVW